MMGCLFRKWFICRIWFLFNIVCSWVLSLSVEVRLWLNGFFMVMCVCFNSCMFVRFLIIGVNSVGGIFR